MHYPVGHAAASICAAEFAILGTDNSQTAASRETELVRRARRPLSEHVEHARSALESAIESFVPLVLPAQPPADLDEMVEIPSGPFVFGVEEDEIADEPFDWRTCPPRRVLHVPTFYIDRFPVTNDKYDQWAESIERLPPEDRRAFEHPGQPLGKGHERNTLGDPRFGSDHPVVGIDWFDAWAFARSHGKGLPTEFQWERAARGPEGLRYPWGDEFRPDAVRYAGETYGADPVDLLHWLVLLSPNRSGEVAGGVGGHFAVTSGSGGGN